MVYTGLHEIIMQALYDNPHKKAHDSFLIMCS